MRHDLLAVNPGVVDVARSRRGRPLEYPPLTITALAVMHTRTSMAPRFLAGVGQAMSPWPKTLHHTTSKRRFETMSLSSIQRTAHGFGIVLQEIEGEGAGGRGNL